jgi:SPOR domain
LLALGVWFYRLGARDAESVPIIRASAEPTKTRPEEPGGVVTPYQDITSYRVAESRAEPPAAVVLAPPPPEPRPEDVAMRTLAPERAPRPGEGPGPAVRSRDTPAWPGAQPGVDPGSGGVTDAPQRGVPAGEAASEAEIDPEELGIDAILVEEEAVPGDAPGTVTARLSEADEIAALVRQAALDDASGPIPEPAVVTDRAPDLQAGGAGLPPLPPARPSDLLARVDEAVRSAERSAAELSRRAAESPVQIQLAADPDEQVIRGMWHRIAQANQDILHDRDLAVQTTVSGGRTYYRLRVGPFSGISEAHAVCQALEARGQDCIVARNG